MVESEAASTVPTPGQPVLEVRGLGVAAGSRQILHDVHLDVHPHRVLAILGPSGAGKSTLLRCLNRLIELDPNLRVQGEIRLHGQSIFSSGVDVNALRARIGMLFQQPVVFPVSIRKNVLFGARHLRRLSRPDSELLAERALQESALWDEVKDRLAEPAAALSVGQQQRLCLARTLALDPEILLMDEPTSALDVRSAEAIEALILRLKTTRTLVLVTHNLEQARRLADNIIHIAVRDEAGTVIERAPDLPSPGETFETSPSRDRPLRAGR